jgi:predicted transcriptional regulator
MNKTQQLILRQLLKISVPLSVYEIAKEVNITYPTAKKYVKEFDKDGVLSKSKSKKTNVKGSAVYCYALKKELMSKIKAHMRNQK